MAVGTRGADVDEAAHVLPDRGLRQIVRGVKTTPLKFLPTPPVPHLRRGVIDNLDPSHCFVARFRTSQIPLDQLNAQRPQELRLGTRTNQCANGFSTGDELLGDVASEQAGSSCDQ